MNSYLTPVANHQVVIFFLRVGQTYVTDDVFFVVVLVAPDFCRFLQAFILFLVILDVPLPVFKFPVGTVKIRFYTLKVVILVLG